ncbi:hypothetical protein EV368DRAFT_69319 [Lentinula lateritia]|nr:hypothetical protein EV368DRAFT_69319 [Lentinula lateritia]
MFGMEAMIVLLNISSGIVNFPYLQTVPDFQQVIQMLINLGWFIAAHGMKLLLQPTMAFNKFPLLSFWASNAPAAQEASYMSSLGFDVRWSENPIDQVASSTRFFHVSQLDPSLLSLDPLSKALNTLDISLSSSLSGSDTSAPGSGGGGEDLGNDDIGDEGRSSIGLGGGSTGYSGPGAGTGEGAGVRCGFWDDDDVIGSCLGTGLVVANPVFAVIRILISILNVVFVENVFAISASCSWLGWTVVCFARRVKALSGAHNLLEYNDNILCSNGSKR